MKKIAILVSRNAELKFFLPILQEIFLNGKIVPILITSVTTSVNSGIKKMQCYKASFNPFHDRMDVHYVNELNEIGTVLTKLGIDVLLISGLPLGSIKKIKEQRIKIIYLPHSMDMIVTWPNVYNSDFFRSIDGFFCFSQYWKDGMIEELKKQSDFKKEDIYEIKNKTYVVGMPELDQIKMFNKQAILEKYKLPVTKRKIVFFDPVGIVSIVPNFFYKYYFCQYGSKKEKLKRIFKNLITDVWTSPEAIWKFPGYLLKILKSGQIISNYETLFLRVKKFCVENDYLLICKSREKNNDPDFVKFGCDFFTYDREYMPFTLLELLFISDIYIGFNSSAIMEAVYCNLPVISFHIFPTEYQFNDYGGNVYQFIERWFNAHGEWLNYSGINRVCHWNQNEEKILNSITDSTINSQDRGDYITKFLGFDDMQSSNRILKVLEDNYL